MAAIFEGIKPQDIVDENACVVCFKPSQIYSIG